ncbi:MAG: peptidase [Oscillospiraceae bacterium]|nr:peptidase [Oscillospiraceae bacterium]
MIPYILIILVILVIARNICIVPQAYAYVVERFGIFDAVWDAGFHFKIPIISRIAKKVSLKEQVVDFPPQPVITRDNVTMQIDTVVFFQVTDPKLFAYGVERPISAIENLTATTLRNIIGDMELDHTLTSRDTINSQITSLLDEATDRWGIKVNRVELKNIIPPAEIQDAMEKQMKAERQRRESILRAEGEAMAIMTVQKALADSIVMLNEANPNKQVLTLKSLEALQKVADGQATKLIIPSEIQNLAGLVASVKELADETRQ